MSLFNTLLKRCGLDPGGFGELEQTPELSQRALKQLFACHRIGEVLPYESYDTARGLFFNKSSTGFVIEFPPLVGCSPEIEKELSGLFQHTLPEGSSIQFLLWADSKIEPFLNHWQETRVRGIFSTLASKRVSFLKENSTSFKNMASLRNFRCIVSISLRNKRENPVELQGLVDLRHQVVTTFRTLGLSVQVWAPKDLLQFVNDILCFESSVVSKPVDWNPYDLICNQVGTSTSILQLDPQNILFEEGRSRAKSYYS